MFEITPYTTIESDNAPLSASQQNELAYYIRSRLSYDSRLPEITVGQLVEQFAPFQLMTNEGKLVKRVSKWVKKQYDVKLHDWQLSELGEVFQSFFPKDFNYDITDDFSWQRGDFGDSGSCFWGDRTQARTIIYEAGGRAIRFFHDEGMGYGRAWVLPYDDQWIVFNAYGSNLELIRERIQLIYPGCKTGYVNLENHGSTSGMVYINNGRGLVVSPKEEVEEHSREWIDLEVGTGSECTCYHCGDFIDEDEATYVNYEPVCEYCLSNHYSYCDRCEEYHDNDCGDYIEVVKSRRGSHYTVSMWLCDRCRSLDYTECDNCSYYVTDYDGLLTEVEGGDCVCPICLENEYEQCPKCDTYVRKGDDCCQDEEEDEQEEEMLVHFEIHQHPAYALEQA